MMKRIIYTIVACIIIFIVNGCKQKSTPTVHNKGNQVISPEETSESDPTIEKTLKTELYPKITLTSTIFPTSTLTPTFTPNPTIAPDKAFEHWKAYLRDLSDCELPCIWGITPGETSFKYLHKHILPMGSVEFRKVRNGIWFYRVIIPVPEDFSEKGYLAAVYTTDGEIITEILTYLRYLNMYEEILWVNNLEGFGKPDEIWLTLIITPSPDTVWYRMGLKYDDIGVFAFFEGETKRIGEDGARLCPLSSEFSKTSGQYIITWSGGERNRISDFNTMESRLKFHRLEEFNTEITVEKYYAAFIEAKEDICFDVFLPKDD